MVGGIPSRKRRPWGLLTSDSTSGISSDTLVFWCHCIQYVSDHMYRPMLKHTWDGVICLLMCSALHCLVHTEDVLFWSCEVWIETCNVSVAEIGLIPARIVHNNTLYYCCLRHDDMKKSRKQFRNGVLISNVSKYFFLLIFSKQTKVYCKNLSVKFEIMFRHKYSLIQIEML